MPRFLLSALPALAAACLLVACGSAVKTVPKTEAAVPGSAPGPVYGAKPPSGSFGWSAAMEAAYGRLGSGLRGSGVSVAKTSDDRIWLTLPGDLAFEPNRSALKPSARGLLDQVVVAVRAHEAAQFRIVGHTDSKGSASANDALSLDRAASTRDWLVARGLPPVRFAVAGRGARDPLASNDDEAGRAKNRRVEILISERGAAEASNRSVKPSPAR